MTDRKFVILGNSLPFQLPDNPKNENFQIQKNTWRYYHLKHLHHKWQSYDAWFLRYGPQWTEFSVIWTVFCLTTWKIKVLKKWKNSWWYHHFTQIYMYTINDNHMMYGSWDTEHDGQNFFSIWTIFCPKNLKNLKNQNLEKMKKPLEISSFYTNVSQIMIIWCTVPDIQCMTNVILIFHFGIFFALLKSKF